MILQKVIFPKNKTEPDELFFLGKAVPGFPAFLEKGEKISLGTYFNSFSYTKYRDFTRVSEITANIVIKGRAKISLCVYDGAESSILCSSVSTDGACATEFFVKFSDLPESGFLYPVIEAEEGCEILSADYRAEIQPSRVNCCGAICTYKREGYVLANIEQLKGSDFSFLSRIFVIDNGNTLDAAALSDGFVKVLPNKNYGGSGGFTRGLIEASRGGFSHVILMDDDIDFHSEVLERMTVFVSVLREECANAWFSAAMLRKSDPRIQYEMGARWNGSFIEHRKHDVYVNSPEALLENLENEGLSYGAWWCLCMPVSVVSAQRLPFPFFIKFDDAEYGLRREPSVPIVTMNGAAVTHEDFESKFSFSLIYYDCRNQLVLNSALYGRGNLPRALKRLIKTCGKQLLLYRYDIIPIILRAFRDYLKGVSFFLECNEERLNRELLAMSPKQSPVSEIPPQKVRSGKGMKLLQVLTLGGHLIPAFLLKKEPLYLPVTVKNLPAAAVHKTLIQYQNSGGTALVTNRSFAKFIKCMALTAAMAMRLIFCFSRAERDFAQNKEKITSLEFWERHLGIE